MLPDGLDSPCCSCCSCWCRSNFMRNSVSRWVRSTAHLSPCLSFCTSINAGPGIWSCWLPASDYFCLFYFLWEFYIGMALYFTHPLPPQHCCFLFCLLWNLHSFAVPWGGLLLSKPTMLLSPLAQRREIWDNVGNRRREAVMFRYVKFLAIL